MSKLLHEPERYVGNAMLNPDASSSLTRPSVVVPVDLTSIRHNLRTFSSVKVCEATQISPVALDQFLGGGSLSEEQVDMVVGFMRGEYSYTQQPSDSITGTGKETGVWRRNKLGGKQAVPMALAYPSPLSEEETQKNGLPARAYYRPFNIVDGEIVP